MKNRIRKVIYLIFFVIILSAFLFTSASDNDMKDKNTIKKNINNEEKNMYDNLWKKISEFEAKGLPKSALELVNKVYELAISENNTSEIIKSIIYKMKFRVNIEEGANEKFMKEVEEFAVKCDSPAKEILYSFLADMYWGYLQSNLYNITGRTEMEVRESDDVKTWDFRKFITKCSDLYLKSIENSNRLMNTDINDYYELIIRQFYLDFLRPTLYDMLVNKALDFFMNEQGYVSSPVYKFELKDENLFSPAGDFINLKITTEDTGSLKYRAVLLMQDLMKFHLHDKDRRALVDIDLKRLRFVRGNSINETKDTLFLNALKKMQDVYKNEDSYSAVSHEIAKYYFERSAGYKPGVQDEYSNDRKTALELCENVIKKFPDAFDIQNCIYLKSEILKKDLKIKCERVNIPHRPFLSLIEYKNLNKIYFKIARLDDFQKEKVLLYGYNQDKLLEYYKSKKAAAEWEQILPEGDDYNTHSTEIRINGLDPGYYVILAGTDKKFSRDKNSVAYYDVWVSNISFIKRENITDRTWNVNVFERDTGRPLENVNVQIYEEKYNYMTRKYYLARRDSYKSDMNGNFVIKGKARYFSIDFRTRNDRLFLQDRYYQNSPYKYSEYNIKTIFFTDRSIYRPGQNIYFKGMILDTTDKRQNKIIPDRSATIYLYDANWEKISELRVKTNQYGTFSGSFTAPVGRLNGIMYVYNSDDSGRADIRVEEYKRPKFEVTFDPVKGNYKLRKAIRVKGEAKSYAGSDIDNAVVKYRVVRDAEYPYYFYWYYYPAIEQMEIANGLTKTDEKGEFEINFDLIPDPKISRKLLPIFTYTVYADVTDINGETHSNQIHIRAGYVSLKIDVDIPEYVAKGAVDKFEIDSRNLNGQYENITARITIGRLKNPDFNFIRRYWDKPDMYSMPMEEYRKYFPGYAYAKEDEINTWEKEAVSYDAVINTERSRYLEIKNFGSWETGSYVMELTAGDRSGEEIKIVKYFSVYSHDDNKIPLNKTLWVNEPKKNYQPGDIVRILYGTSAPEGYVLIETEQDNKILDSKIVRLSPGLKTLDIPIKEEYRGNLTVHFSLIRENRFYQYNSIIIVPWSNKELKMEFLSFRNKLTPGEKEEWKIKITGPAGEKMASEMVATLYDASLNAFVPHDWPFGIYPVYYSSLDWMYTDDFASVDSVLMQKDWNPYYSPYYYDYPVFDMFGFYIVPNFYYDGRNKYEYVREGKKEPVKAENIDRFDKKQDQLFASKIREEDLEETGKTREKDLEKKPKFKDKTITVEKDEGVVQIRKNFNETAFFYPHLETNEKGEVIISFTIPDALTRWKMMGFAHTKNLEYGYIENYTVTQKDLMIFTNIPRFFREGDTIYFSAKVSNMAENDISGIATLQLFDAFTMKPLDDIITGDRTNKSFNIKKGASGVISWKLKIPEGLQAVTYRIIAKSGKYSDGEESSIPVLSNRMLVTESLPLPVRGRQTRTFRMQKFLDPKKSDTIKNEKLTLEFTSNPAWYAIQTLPYLIEYPYECSEQVFSRLYANSIASHIVNSNPKIREVFDKWKTSDALLSNLQKNEELKSLLLEETPWVYEAKSDEARKKQIGLLFDLSRMSNQLNNALKKLKAMQTPNGGFPWFTGLPDDRYITQHIIAGLGKLKKLNIEIASNNTTINDMAYKGIRYLDDRMREDYEYLVRNKIDLDNDNLYYTTIHYLYARSFFTNIEISSNNKQAFDYWIKQAGIYWPSKGVYMQGLTALALSRYDDKKAAMDIVKSLKENSIENDELGMYWKANIGGYFWYEAPIETQSLLIEAFYEVASDIESVENMKVWLLKQKQTHDWKTTKATADACYALLLRGTNWLADEEQIRIHIGEIEIIPDKLKSFDIEAGTGYFKTSWNGNEIKDNMGEVTVTKNTEGVAWGSLYWQYFENLDRITPHDTPLKLKRQLFLQENSATGPKLKEINEKIKLKPGDLLKARIILSVDRDMEYIHMKDMRASGLEPVNVLSSYKYRDGLWYYESTKDASTNFFFPRLPKGTYVFEYPLRVTHRGNFSNGITTIQCMYAPEFTSHSEGIRIDVAE